MLRPEELPMVAMQSMNDTHLEDLMLINQLLSAAQSKNHAATKIFLDELVEHTIAHFSGEEEMMREKKFPPYPVHKGEHDRVLKELKNIQKIFNEGEGDFALITSYIEGSLTPWLIDHIKTLDTVTAMFLTTGMSPCSSGNC